VFSEEVTQTVEDHATGDPCGICLDDLERDHAFHSDVPDPFHSAPSSGSLRGLLEFDISKWLKKF
jgi:hypothetical protein